MFCPNCGAENKSDGKFCVQCGKKLQQENQASPKADETAYRSTNIASTSSSPIQQESAKNPIIAAVLSAVIVGVGQMYNGEIQKGILMLIGAVVLGLLTGGILTFVLWIWAIIDAYNVAKTKA